MLQFSDTERPGHKEGSWRVVCNYLERGIKDTFMDGMRVGGMGDKVERGHLERGGISGTCKNLMQGNLPGSH